MVGPGNVTVTAFVPRWNGPLAPAMSAALLAAVPPTAPRIPANALMNAAGSAAAFGGATAPANVACAQNATSAAEIAPATVPGTPGSVENAAAIAFRSVGSA